MQDHTLTDTNCTSMINKKEIQHNIIREGFPQLSHIHRPTNFALNITSKTLILTVSVSVGIHCTGKH